MSWVDIVVVAVIALSAIIGFVRGFLRELLGLASWVVAFYLAFKFAAPFSDYLQQWIDVDSARLAVAFAIIFLVVLIIGAILNYLLGRLVSGTGLAGTDRVIGLVYGIVRGAAVLIVLTLLVGVTSIPRETWWQNSMFTGQLEDGAIWVRAHLPADIAKSINYPDKPLTWQAGTDES